MALYFTYLTSLLFSAIMAFLCRKDLKGRLLSAFVPYLILVFCQELLVYIFYILPDKGNGYVYNIYMPLTTIFFAVLYYRVPLNKPMRRIIVLLMAVYLTAVFVTFTSIQSILVYNSYLFLAGGFVIACCAVFFLVNYFTLDNSVVEKKWLPFIWITIGIVLFYPVVSISYALHKYLQHYRLFGLKPYQAMPQLMSILMYSCFAISFYLCRKKI